jgi:hypothetical protein
MHLVGQVTVACGAPFHGGRLDLLNPRSCESWAKDAAAAWVGSRDEAVPIDVEAFKRALRVAGVDLLALHEREATQGQTAIVQQPSYIIRERRICRLHDGRIEPLCNFTARIIGEVLIDDSAIESGELTIEGILDDGQTLGVARVPLVQFGRMDWVLIQWGARARITAGAGIKDQLREAIQALSPEVPRTRVYAHCGWRKLGGRWYWLHAAGAVGDSASHSLMERPEAVRVQLAGNLQHVRLPLYPSGDALATAVRASLALLDMVPAGLGSALLAAVYRAPLAEVMPVDSSVYLAGQSGTFKSELTALAQAHFGAGFTRLSLPAQWMSTTNALERLAFEAKDCLLVIDDFAPKGSTLDIARLHAAADRVFRGAGNHTGRGRMAPDGSLRPEYPPRGMLLASGEDVPSGHSLAARLLIVQVGPGDVGTNALTTAQHAAAQGLYAGAMAGYLAWLAPRIETLRTVLPRRVAALRVELGGVRQHRRVPDAVANLLLGWELWLQFAREIGVVDEADAGALWERVQAALVAVGDTQTQFTATQEPAQQFVDLLSAALAGQRAYLVTLTGERPTWPERWGWRVIEQTVWDRDAECLKEKRSWTIAPGSRPIGWVVSENEVYLQPDNAYAAAQHLASEKRESLSVGEKTLWKRLHDAGMLASVDGTDHKHLIRRKIGGHRQYVLHVHSRFLGAMPTGKSGVSGDHGIRTISIKEPSPGQTPVESPCSADITLLESREVGADWLISPTE